MFGRTPLRALWALSLGALSCSTNAGQSAAPDDASRPEPQPPAFATVAPRFAQIEAEYRYAFRVADPDTAVEKLVVTVASQDTCGGKLTTAADGIGLYAFTPSKDRVDTKCLMRLSVSDGDFEVPQDSEVEIIDSNDPPMFASSAPTSATEQVPYVYAIIAVDPDLPAQTISLAVDTDTDTCHGTVRDQGGGSGTYSFTPDELAGGSRCSVGVRAVDELGLATVQSTEVAIAEDNAAPVNGAPQRVEVDELTVARFDLAPTDSDLPAQTLTCALVSNTCPGGALTACSFEWTPTEQDGPLDGCEVVTRVSDGIASSDATTVITVREVNLPPRFTSAAPTTAAEGALYRYSATVADDDVPAQILACSVSASDTCGGVPSGCEYQFTPSEAMGGTACVVGLVVDDGRAQTEQTTTVAIADVNTPPTIALGCPAHASELGPISCTVTVADPDLPAQPLACRIAPTSTCTGLTLHGCTVLDVAAQGETAGPGSCVVAIVVDDGAATALDASTVIIDEVNANPTVAVNCPASVGETAFASCTLAASDPDVPVQTLTCALAAATTCAGASVTGCASVAIPPQGESAGPGSCAVVVDVSDGAGGHGQGTAALAITEENSPPVDNAPASASGPELALLSFALAPSDADLPRQTLTCSMVTNTCPGGALNGCAFEWTPAEADGPTACAVTTRVSDGVSFSAPVTTTVTIAEVNTAPVDHAPGMAAADEQTVLSFAIVPSDVDLPAQPLTCSVVSNTCAGGYLIGCTFYWTPTEADGPTTCAVTTRASDGVAFSTPVTTTITINETNAPPVDNAPTAVAGDELTHITFALAPSDPDIPVQTLTCSIVTNGCPGGTLTGCTFDWTPAEADGPTSCVVTTRVYDGVVYGAPVATTVTVREVNVAPTNHAPTSVAGDELTALAFDIAPSDPDLPAQTLTCSIVTNTCPGGALVGCRFAWTPSEADGPTVCTVTTRVYDGVAYSASVATTVTVREVNVAPTDNAPLTASVDEMTQLSLSLAPSDPDLPAQTLTCSVVSNTCTGAVLNGCTFQWTPTEAQGPMVCTLTTRVYDGVAYSASVQTVVTVNEVNTPPTNNAPANISGNELSTVTFAISPTDPDLPAQTLTCSIASSTCTGGALSGCTFSWTPTESEGPQSCSVVTSVSDGVAATTRSTAVQVNEVNVAPTSHAPAAVSGDENTLLSFDVAPTDPDLPAQTLTCSVYSSTCAGGSLTGCTWNWTPTEANGPATCTVKTRVYDGVAYSAVVSTTVTVNEVHVAPSWSTAPVAMVADVSTASSMVNGVATDPDLPNAGTSDPGYLTCMFLGTTCSFPVTVSGTGAGTVSCLVAFTPGATTATCNITVAVTDGSGRSVSRTFAVAVKYACSDGIDNDGDGLIDYPADPGCSSATDNSERGTAACDDGIDNDGDGKSDYPDDPGCTSPADTSETTTWYVDITRTSGAQTGRTWSDAFLHPQGAATIAGGGDEIWVADGTYLRTTGGTSSVLVVPAGVNVYGGFAGTETSVGARSGTASILDGEAQSSPVVRLGSSARLDGFTVQRGHGDPGGGLRCEGLNATVANCDFASNYSGSRGGAVYVESQCSLTVSRCSFTSNRSATGGGAIGVYGGSSIAVSDSTFTSNTAPTAGGAAYVWGNATFANCLFAGNTVTAPAATAAVMYLDSATVSFSNCTMTGNSSALIAGALTLTSHCAVTITDSIIWGNSAPVDTIDNTLGSTLTVTYSDVQQSFSGSGDININPQFVTGPDGAYYLNQSTSPCVNAGGATAASRGMSSKTTSTTGALDSGTVDMGYHYDP